MKHQKQTIRYSALLFFIMMLPAITFARIDEMRNLDLIAIEHWYDDVANQSLQRFFPQDRFLVSVRAEMRTLEYTTSIDQSSAATQSGRTTGNLTFSIQNRLPGLPALGSRQEPAQPPPAPGANASVHDLARVQVAVWLDESFSDMDVLWVEDILQSVLKLDDQRGDVITVTRRLFSAWEAPAAVSAPSFEELLQDQMQSTDEHFASGGGILQTIRDALRMRTGIPVETWMVTAGLIALMLIVIGTLIILMRSKQKRITGSNRNAGEQAWLPLMNRDKDIQQDMTPPAENGNDARFTMGRVVASDIDNRVEAVQFLLHMFMNFPEEMGRMIDYWITTDPVYGGERAVTLIDNVDRKMISKIRPFISQKANYELNRRLQEAPPQSRHAVEMLESCAKDIQKRLYEDDGRFRLHILQYFDFLNHIYDDIILQLMNHEAPDIAAFVVFHLPYQRVNSFMKQIDPQQSRMILMQLPKVRSALYDRYETVASHLFDACRYLNEQSGYSESDILQTVQIIENLEEDMVEEYLQRFEQEDAAFSDKLRQQLILAGNLPSVHHEILKEGARAFSMQRLAIVLTDMPESVRDEILSIYSEREATMLLDEIELNSNLPETQVFKEREAFVQVLREVRGKRGNSDLNLRKYSVRRQV